MRHISIFVLFISFLVFTVGCAGGSSPTAPGLPGSGQDSNLVADNQGATPPNDNERQGVDSENEPPPVDIPELTDNNEHPMQGQPLQGSRALWGLYQFVIDTEADTLEIVPLRAANIHLNALRFLEPGGQYGMVQLIGGLNWNGDKSQLDIDIQLTHPFPSHPQFSGFDVKGILITRATQGSLSIPDLVTPGIDEFRLLNPDGYTRWWNPVEFEGNTIFSYTDGALGMKDSVWDFSGTFNGYKTFSDELGLNDPVESQDTAMRGVFSAGASNQRHYTIAVPSFPSSLIFNYAIDASWEPPLVKPPVIPDDFPDEANQPEPWAITIEESVNTLYYDENIPEQGGELLLKISVYDWQSGTPAPGGSIVRVVCEWPGLFDATEATFVSDMGDYATYEVIVTPLTGALTDKDMIDFLVLAESTDGAGYGGILDASVPLIAGARFTEIVYDEETNVGPQITSGIDGEPSPGLVVEQYTVAAYDPNGDTLTYSWTVNPNIIDDPGNGDGTIDIDWSTFGLGDFTIECSVSDMINPAVGAVPLEVSVGNTPPQLGEIEGPTDVDASFTDATYTILATDPDIGQTLSYTWSFVPNGDPEDFSIPGDLVDGHLEVDFSNVAPGLYDINVEVSDGFANVPAVPIIVTHTNTPPTVGNVEGKTPVYDADINTHYQALWSDPDNTQTLTFLWSLVPNGDPADYTLPSNPDGSIDLDWSGYGAGDYDVNVLADDGIDQAEGTLLTVTKIQNQPPVAGAVTGPTPVYHTDTASDYNASMSDPEVDPLTVLWSVVPHDDPPDYSIAGVEGDPLTVDWSTYDALGEYDINVQVDDTFNPPVEGTLLVVSLENTPPTVGAVSGPTPVDGNDTASGYSATISDLDTLQILTTLWSIVPTGNLPVYSIPDGGSGSIDVDWSGYAVGLYDVSVQVDDGFGPVEGTLMTVDRINTVPEINSLAGPTNVYCTDTSSLYTADIFDPDTTQSLTILWSVVLHGLPPMYMIPDNGDGTINIDWSAYPLGDYDITVQVDDGFAVVESAPYVVSKLNTPPVVGAVEGPTPVSESDTVEYNLVPASTDCDTGQVLTRTWSIEPTGQPQVYTIIDTDDNISVDWSIYGMGSWTIGCQVDDGIDSTIATPLDVIVTIAPCEGGAHTWLGEVFPNKYSVVGAMSVLPRADISFLEGGLGLYEGLAIAQTGPQTLGIFNADTTGGTVVANIYNMGSQDAVMSLDSEPVEGRILAVTVLAPNVVKVIDSSVILGNPFMHPVDSGDPLISWVALDTEADGDFWAVQRDATLGITYSLVHYTFIPEGTPGDPVYMLDATGTLDITPQVGTDTDIFDIAINRTAEMLYLLEGGAIDQGTMQTYHIVDGFQAAFMGTLGSALFSQPLDFDESAFTGFAGYADIDVDHRDGNDERCRILLYGRLEDLSSELIRMDSSYNVLDVQNYASAWPAFAINHDPLVSVRNLIMPDIDSVEYWDTPVDW